MLKGFRAKLPPNAVHILQIEDIHDQNYDFALGLRRDQDAMALWSQTHTFHHNGRESEV